MAYWFQVSNSTKQLIVNLIELTIIKLTLSISLITNYEDYDNVIS